MELHRTAREGSGTVRATISILSASPDSGCGARKSEFASLSSPIPMISVPPVNREGREIAGKLPVGASACGYLTLHIEVVAFLQQPLLCRLAEVSFCPGRPVGHLSR